MPLFGPLDQTGPNGIELDVQHAIQHRPLVLEVNRLEPIGPETPSSLIVEVVPAGKGRLDVPHVLGDIKQTPTVVLPFLIRPQIDLSAYEPSDLEEWLDKLEVKGLSRRLCLEAWDRPGFYPLKNEIILVIPVQGGTELSQESDYLTFLCRENLLLTFHQKPVRQFSDVHDSESWLPDRSISGLVSAMMIDFSLTGLQHTANLRNEICDLEDKMDRDPNSVDAEQIMDMRSEILLLGSPVLRCTHRTRPTAGSTSSPFSPRSSTRPHFWLGSGA